MVINRKEKLLLLGIIILLAVGVLGTTVYFLTKKMPSVPETPKQEVSEQPVSQKPKGSTSTQPEESTSMEEKLAHALQEEIIPNAKINTSDWNLYVNKKYGFEIKYPHKWIIQEGANYNEKNYFVVFIRSTPELPPPPLTRYPYFPYPFYEGVLIREESKEPFTSVSTIKDLKKVLREKAGVGGEVPVGVIPVEVTIGHNIPAVIIYQGSNKWTGYDFYILKNGKVLVISIFSGAPPSPEGTWKEILSTVKFLKD